MNPVAFALRVIAAMIAVFSIWWLAGSQWLQPAASLADSLLSAWLPRMFHELELSGDTVMALTHWEKAGDYLVPAAQLGTCIGFDVNLRILSYSFPFFLSLQIALWEVGSLLKTALALFALYLVLSISLTFVVAREIILGLEPVFIETSRYWYTNHEFIVLGYQAAVLLLPTLAPILLWVAVNQATLRKRFGFNL